MLDSSELSESQISSCWKIKISNYICFKNGKQLHINNCLAAKLINMIIHWSLGSYLFEKQLNKHKENIWQTTWILSQTNYISTLKTKNNLQKQISPSLGQNNASPPWKL